MPNFNPEHEAAMNKHMTGVAGATAERMFGFPCFKVNGTLAVSVKKEGVVLKVGEKRAAELIGKGGVKMYEPLAGRPWKAWVLLDGNFDTHKGLFAEAADFVRKGK